jgi:hypothetical protein
VAPAQYDLASLGARTRHLDVLHGAYLAV